MKSPAKHNPVAAALGDRQFQTRKVQPRVGKKAYKRLDAAKRQELRNV